MLNNEKMDSIVIYPKNEKQESLLRSLLIEMKVHFEPAKPGDESILSKEEFNKKIDASLEQVRTGKTTPLPRNKQKEFLGL